MQRLDLSTAKDKILADIRRYVSEVQRITMSPVETVEDGIRTLIALRRTSYEDLNQIQHEHAALCAVHWLIAERGAPEGANWQWNPRQTGDTAEPDIRAVLNGKTIISGEVTTSPVPKGVVDSRMASTLRKLTAMEGQRFYFVLTAAMANRARTKAVKAGYVVDIVQLSGAALAIERQRPEESDASTTL
ncbi:MAG TPA: hypothetical protein VN838_13860 [Bradyrhizobium sp.]|nr:hypothetical protein [Bradyrhizobium sp.]